MAENITMKQVPNGTVKAVDDRILYDYALSSGVIYGCEISYIGNNMIHINAGYGIIKGGLFEMEDHIEYVDYAENESTPGQIYLHFDAAADDKLTIVKETTPSLHVLVQDDDANYDGGVYEIQLCTFTATTTTLENVKQTFQKSSMPIDVLDTLPEIVANTTPGKAAGALAVKELNNNLSNISVYVGDDKKLHFVDKDGADSALPFSSGKLDIGSMLSFPSSDYYAKETVQLSHKPQMIFVSVGSNAPDVVWTADNPTKYYLATNDSRYSGYYDVGVQQNFENYVLTVNQITDTSITLQSCRANTANIKHQIFTVY